MKNIFKPPKNVRCIRARHTKTNLELVKLSLEDSDKALENRKISKKME